MLLRLPDNDVAWGKELTFVVALSWSYWPGFVGLFNSAILNRFEGTFLFYPLDEEVADFVQWIDHPQLRVKKPPKKAALCGDYPTLTRLENCLDFPPGNYCLIDTDIIIERPLGDIVNLVEEGMVLSVQPGFDHFFPLLYSDATFCAQCEALGLTPPKACVLHPYVNAGMVFFQFPRDQEFVHEWARVSLKTRAAALSAAERERFECLFYFVEQDALNTLIRVELGEGTCPTLRYISPEQLELGGNGSSYGKEYLNRPFPWSRQAPGIHKTHIIHDTAGRRPWSYKMEDNSLKSRLYRTGLGPWVRRFIKDNVNPYERAWFYYACQVDAPLSPALWIEAWPALKKAVSRSLWQEAFT